MTWVDPSKSRNELEREIIDVLSDFGREVDSKSMPAFGPYVERIMAKADKHAKAAYADGWNAFECKECGYKAG